MTDRIHSVTIVLDADYRTDDVEPILTALRMVRGVADVQPNVADSNAYMARARVASDLGDEILGLFRKLKGIDR